MAITVNQTKSLVNQAISVSWTGAAPTFSDPTTQQFDTTFAGNYLQIFECWGDPSATDPLNAVNPGPAPTQCQFGGESPSPLSSYPVQETGFEFSRVLSQQSWSTYDSSSGWVDQSTGFKIEPFDAVDGTRVNQEADYNASADPLHPKAFWLNPYFSFNTSNEVPFTRTYGDASGGHGEQNFQVQTGLEAPGLGCGQKLQHVSGGTKVPQCWLVVVPRGTPTTENPPNLSGVKGVVTSPLAPAAWANRIAIPLDFQPVDSPCTLKNSERRIVGSELATAAVTSWQPALCTTPTSPPFNYTYVSDDRARDNLTQQGFGGAGMSVFSTPVAASSLSGVAPVTYAPLTLSGVVVSFDIERTPQLQPDGQLQPDELPLSGLRIEHLQLTPRLVAKLLTESYQAQLVDVLASKPAAYNWVLNNPTSIVHDPDFLQFNPEFSLLTTQQEIDAGTLVVEESSSDAAAALWSWVLADPEARQWLDGTPDHWGMRVNPIFSTRAANNSTGTAFGTPTPNQYPKADPYCHDTGEVVGSPPQKARPICMLDWSPYVLTMQDAAQATGAANSGAHTSLNPIATPDSAWGANGPQKAGTHFILSITDSASAARFGVQTAALSRAGDDGSGRAFVAADASGMLAGVAAMHGSPVLVGDPTTHAPGAYPLTMLTYAATTPTTLDAAARTDYASFLSYATGTGQTTGVSAGNLPPGYVPLPEALRAQDAAAINAILHPPAVASGTDGTFSGANGSTSSGSGGAAAGGSASNNATEAGATNGVSSSATKPGGPQSAQFIGVTRGFASGPTRLVVPIVAAIGLAALVAALTRRRRPKVQNGTEQSKPESRAPRRPSAFEPWIMDVTE